MIIDARRSSSVELLILHELWAGERLVLDKTLSRYRRGGRPTSVSAVPLGSSIDIWRSCRFLGRLLRASRSLLGGFDRFFPCRIGGNHCRLRHIGWEKWSWTPVQAQGDFVCTFCGSAVAAFSGILLLLGLPCWLEPCR